MKAPGPAKKHVRTEPLPGAIERRPDFVVNPAVGYTPSRPPVALIIMDGLAYGSGSDDSRDNAIAVAHTPTLDRLWKTEPHTQLHASGEAVGLPEGQMGNSEVGHLNVGAGRCVYQELSRINLGIAEGSFALNDVLLDAVDDAEDNGGTVHLLGLLSDGGVHSHITHLKALVTMAAERGASSIAIHALLDGRDVSPTSGVDYLADLRHFLADFPQARIATVMGRYYGMDRDQRWDRTQRAYDALVNGLGEYVQPEHLIAAVYDAYERGITDEFMEPLIVSRAPLISNGDSLIVFNFRPDRARQIMHALADEAFDAFHRGRLPQITAVCLTEYDTTLGLPVAFPKSYVKNTLADVLAESGLRQLHIAETEKYAHVTFFFNGGVEKRKANEMRVLIPSPKVATYDLQPEMSAAAVTDALITAIRTDTADVYIVNYANGDMVGHSGNFEATVRAIETVDHELSRVLDALRQKGGIALITADHGNAEHMCDSRGECYTAHTSNMVPLIVVGSDALGIRPDGTLADIAPTLLGFLDLNQPREWTGRDLMVN